MCTVVADYSAHPWGSALIGLHFFAAFRILEVLHNRGDKGHIVSLTVRHGMVN
ncbi:hypothetical protein EFER_2395 [Escherichia fergusonii ATCC 35469]|uniref:Uncharacterized protein n=1 Tax=Escherichia fergusonii (strain ATCC 35469 / DSM 13698 / CCUG 18766 / IAM 14443 / JCM 21226 / LMG 7866 / NBRC 102419 / NCTC 12128 / CDC 0568-73) TaxID=585054 RepID=B7LKP9_ESCF3|nr:hypothetical protein EFER_2395 [Escherichia fergusonii ATCC 35469]